MVTVNPEEAQRDPIFLDYVIIREEFEIRIANFYGFVSHALKDVDPSIREQLGDEVYQEMMRERRESAEAFKEFKGLTWQDSRESGILHILRYPHRIAFDLGGLTFPHSLVQS